jgi:DNA-binding MarR family transcriptional regulator
MKGERAGPSQVRRLLFSVIAEIPGITPVEIVERTGLNEGTVRYHLDLMERKGDITVRVSGKRKECFPSEVRRKAGMEGPARCSIAKRRVLDMIRSMPHCTRTDLMGRVNASGPELNRILRAIERKGLIVREVRDGDERFSAVGEKRFLDEMMLELIDRYLEGTIDLERFISLKEEIQRRRSEL